MLEQLEPDFRLLAQLEGRGVIVTAPGREVDFVSRCFFPRYGVDEDPVTGSAHTTLTPYWAERLGKNRLTARQISRRGGNLEVELQGNRTKISGHAVTYLRGKIEV
jgi:predicted PhzF superfamily epimerase YddE/YHI9